MADNEMLNATKDLLQPIHIKLEHIEHRTSQMEFRMSKLEYRMSKLEQRVEKGFRKNNDEIQTLVAVLTAKNIFPSTMLPHGWEKKIVFEAFAVISDYPLLFFSICYF